MMKDAGRHLGDLLVVTVASPAAADDRDVHTFRGWGHRVGVEPKYGARVWRWRVMATRR